MDRPEMRLHLGPVGAEVAGEALGVLVDPLLTQLQGRTLQHGQSVPETETETETETVTETETGTKTETEID